MHSGCSGWCNSCSVSLLCHQSQTSLTNCRLVFVCSFALYFIYSSLKICNFWVTVASTRPFFASKLLISVMRLRREQETVVTILQQKELRWNELVCWACLPGARFTKYLTAILRLSYDNAKVTIDLRRTSNLQNVLRRTRRFSEARFTCNVVRSCETVFAN